MPRQGQAEDRFKTRFERVALLLGGRFSVVQSVLENLLQRLPDPDHAGKAVPLVRTFRRGAGADATRTVEALTDAAERLAESRLADWKGAMVNVLVVDPGRCSCFLVKSILLGRRFNVSISSHLPEAQRKVETGLFDVLMIDTTEGGAPQAEFLAGVADLLPGLPIVVIHRDERPAYPEVDVFGYLRKPIRVQTVGDLAARAAAAVGDPRHGGPLKRAVDWTAEVRVGGEGVRCVARHVSLSGALLEAEHRAFDEFQAFHRFFTREGEAPLTATFLVNESRSVTAPALVAFSERTPDQKVRQVGLRFSGLLDSARKDLETLLGSVA